MNNTAMSITTARTRRAMDLAPIVAIMTAMTLLLATSSAPAQQSTVATLSAAPTPSLWPTPAWPLPPDAAIEQRVQALLQSMTLEEKVGQVIQGDIASLTPDDVRTYHLGSVLNGGSSGPYGDDFAPAAKWLELADAFYNASIDKSGNRAAIPVIWGTDAVHGHSNIIGATLFPHNVGLGAMRDPAMLAKIAAVTSAEVRVTGMEWTFAPAVSVPQDVRWGRSYEGYSEDPSVVASYVGVFVRGLQGEPNSPGFLRPPHVLATTKHYLADGGTDSGRDQGDARISEVALRDIHAAGYSPAISAGVQTVMASFSSWNGTKITGNRGLLTDVLKNRMGFQGFIVSDWNAHSQVPGCSLESCPQAINAGLDMYMAPDSWKPLYGNLLKQVRDGTVPITRLDDAVARILRVKVRMGLFEAGPPSKRAGAGQFGELGSPEHRAVAREAVRKSLVLLKNENGLLPLKPAQRVLVAGDEADNIGKQSGGWTITWQGTGLDNSRFPGATSIWKGIQRAVTAAGGTAELSIEGKYSRKPDVAIVVFGENPYAEFQGDITLLNLRDGNDAHLVLMRRLRQQNIPVVAIFLSGRPLWMNREINASNAFVAAWLPGSEGAGVADVLYRKNDGSVAYDFSGKLSFSWPRTVLHEPQKSGQPGYNPLFPLGYGLHYGSNGNVPPLSEAPGADIDSSQAGIFFSSGKLSPPWTLASTDGVRVSRVDGKAQEDSIRMQWSGQTPASVRFDSREAFDFTRETNGDVMLVLTLRVAQRPTARVDLGMACGQACSGSVQLDPAIAEAPANEWRNVAIPLKCFGQSGADMKQIRTALSLRTAGSLDITLQRVALGTEADHRVACTPR
jgi:beta-glucosidase